MKWVAISGSWRKTNNKLKNDVERVVKEIISRGDGIILGGALGVDFIATCEVVRLNSNLNQLKIIIPGKLSVFAEHFQKRAKEGVITKKQAYNLVEQLNFIKKMNSSALTEIMEVKALDTNSYYARNSKIITSADELIAFQVNKSKGTQDAINKARKKGIPTTIYRYTIQP